MNSDAADLLRPQTSSHQLKTIRDRVESDHHPKQRERSPNLDKAFNLNGVEQERLFQVRKGFQQALNKISSNDTKDIGLNECKRVIEANSDHACLRIYLSLLCEKHKTSTTANKELQVLLFGHLARVYKQDMLDPLDKPPNLLKTVVRVCENIHSFMKENSSLIHLACANALVEVLDNCFPTQQKKEDKLSLSLIFYEPMAAIINGGYDMIGQLGAAMAILKLFEYLIKEGHEELYDFLCPKFVQLFYKTKCDNADFIQCMQVIIAHSSLKYLTQFIWEVVQKCLRVIDNNDTQTYLRKIEACNLLKTIALQLKDCADLIMGYMHRQVIKGLEGAQGDRVLKVRQAAIQAKQQWQLVKYITNELEAKKQNQELGENMTAEEIIEARTGYKGVEGVRKQVLEEAQEGLDKRPQRPRTAHTDSQKDLQFKGPQKKFKMLKELARLNQELRVQKPYSPTNADTKKEIDQNWSAATRGQAFLKRHLGTGGGNIPGYETLDKKSPLATEAFKRQSIKDLIVGGLKKGGSLEEYKKGEIEIYDVLQRQYQAEKEQFEQQMDPEYQAIEDRLAKDRQKLAIGTGGGGGPNRTNEQAASALGETLSAAAENQARFGGGAVAQNRKTKSPMRQ